MKALEYQRGIFLNGLSGLKPEFPFTAEQLESRTRKTLNARSRDYIFGGAGSGKTIENNRLALERAAIIPSMLTGTDSVNMETQVFGTRLKHPILASPVGVLEMAHKQGDLALAEACRETESLMVISSQASFPTERIAQVLGNSPRWFQLYWNKNERVGRSFVKRAEDAGCSAVVLTADTPVPGWRTADLEAGFLPFLEGMGIAQYTSDPVFRELAEALKIERQPGQKVTLSLLGALVRMNYNIPGGFLSNLRSGRAIRLIRCFSEHFPHPFVTWNHVQMLKEWTSLPVLVKGIQSAADAQKCFESGADGVWVSNHGGRQIDGAIGSFAALQQIHAHRKGGPLTVFDSGIRSGADVFKVLASGANLAGVGRPLVCGLALGGVRGAVSVLQNMLSELESTMQLSGVSEIAGMNTSFLSYGT